MIVNVGSVRTLCTMAEVKWDGVVRELLRDKTVWGLSVFKDGEYKYQRQIDSERMQKEMTRIVRR